MDQNIDPVRIGYFESELPETKATCFYFNHMTDVYVKIISEENKIEGYFSREDWVKLQEAMLLTMIDVS